MTVAEEPIQSSAVRAYIADLVSRAVGTAPVMEDVQNQGRPAKPTLALRVLEGALLADEAARSDVALQHESCHERDLEDLKDDLDEDDIIVFEESSFSEDDDGFLPPDYSPHVPDFQATSAPLLDRVHVRVADAMGAARNGMSYLGDRLEAFSYGLDDAAEKYTHQLENLEGLVKVRMSTISGKTQATYRVLDSTAAKCKQRLEVGVDLVSGKARVLSQAARVKAGGLSSSKMAKKGRKGLNAARDKVQATLTSQTRLAWQSLRKSRSRGGA